MVLVTYKKPCKWNHWVTSILWTDEMHFAPPNKPWNENRFPCKDQQEMVSTMVSFGAFCLAVRTLTFCQLTGFPVTFSRGADLATEVSFRGAKRILPPVPRALALGPRGVSDLRPWAAFGVTFWAGARGSQRTGGCQSRFKVPFCFRLAVKPPG